MQEDFVQEWVAPIGGALLVHISIAVLASSTLTMPQQRSLEPAPAVIDAEVIDSRTIEAEMQRLRERHEAAERAAAAAKARDVEQELKAAQAVAAAAKARAAGLESAAAAVAKAQAADKERATAQAYAAAETARLRAEQAATAKAREAQLKREREASAQREREAELKQTLAAEERRRSAERSGALAQYKMAVQQKVVRNWIKPAVLPPELECLVLVEQLPTGDVVRAEVRSCNGDESVRRSIESAVLRASPLPLPTNRAVWDRQLEFLFKPPSAQKP